jgi:hypothetical protein
MSVKATFLFADNRSGWSETYYFLEPPDSTLETMSDDFVTNRIRRLGSGAKIIGSRMSKTGSPKNVEIYLYERPGEARDSDATSGAIRLADQTHIAVLLPFKTERGTRRYVTCSGVPDDWMVRSADNKEAYLSSIGQTRFRQFRDYLLLPPWPMQIRERRIDGEYAPKAITDIVENDDGRYQITYAGGAGIAAGDKVVLTKLKGNNLANLKGTKRVVEVLSGTEFVVDAGPRADLGDVSYLSGGFASKVGYEYSTARKSPEPFLLSTRKRGRPLSARRGRRSASR